MALLKDSTLAPTRQARCAATPLTCRQSASIQSSSKHTSGQKSVPGVSLAHCRRTWQHWSRPVRLGSSPSHTSQEGGWNAVQVIQQLGKGTQLAKLYLHNAYRMVPVHSDDHCLLGVRRGEEVFVDTALPFGLRSAPKIFSALSDALAWTLQSKGVTHQLHYLDDFLLMGPPDSSTCAQALKATLDTCQELGVPVAAHKTEGPSCQLTFLGIQINTISMELSLPPDKLSRISATVGEWKSRKVATKKQLQSLIGTLSHAATVIIPGRVFLRRMIDTMVIPKWQHHHVRLNKEFQSDIQWWACFLPGWNGKSILPPAQISHTCWSDASGSWGCGALSHNASWFQLQWPEHWKQHHIAAKELVPIVIAVAIWGQEWSSSTVRAFSDNMEVVCALTSGRARDPLLMHLLRCLHFFCAHYGVVIQARHIVGVQNTAADALSRDKRDVFLSCVPQASDLPAHIPQALRDMLLVSQPDWTSRDQWAGAAVADKDFIMLWAACCMGFFGFMRAGEFAAAQVSEFDPAVSLCPGDIAVDSHQNPTVVQVRLKQNKTDPFRRGVSIFLGRTWADLCPVTAVLAYVAVRPAVNGPFFVFKDGSFLTRDRLVSAIRRALTAAGMDTAGFSGHSFRIGAATTAALVGLEDSTIQMLGRWESAAYQRYLRTPREALAAISARLVSQQ